MKYRFLYRIFLYEKLKYIRGHKRAKYSYYWLTWIFWGYAGGTFGNFVYGVNLSISV